MLTFQIVEQSESYTSVPRSGYTFTYIPEINSSALFGGCKDVEIILFDHLKKQWITKPTAGKKPTLRKYHAAIYAQHISSILITGGQDETGKSLEDFYLLSIKEWKWKKLLLLKQPSPRQKHCVFSLSDTQFIIFGGISMPYNELTNDLWRLIVNLKLDSNKNEVVNLQCSEIKVKGAPQGKCLNDSSVMVGQKLYTACVKAGTKQAQKIQFYCIEIRKKICQKLQISFLHCEVRLFRILNMQNEYSFMICAQEKNSQSQYYIFEQQKNKLAQIQLKSNLDLDYVAEDMHGESWGNQQFITFFKAKKLNILRYHLSENIGQQQIRGTIEDYLIAIKHEQILSQELIKKNNLLEEIYKEMQNYITSLHRQYINFDEDPVVESEKVKHFEDCRNLKTEYSKLDKLYEDVCGNIKFLRGELGNINQDFERCMETQLDEEA